MGGNGKGVSDWGLSDAASLKRRVLPYITSSKPRDPKTEPRPTYTET